MTTPLEKRFQLAFETRDIEEFLELLFPDYWRGVSARIIETGAEFSSKVVNWAPRWSPISPNIRKGNTPFETHVKSCLFRVHDCLHQLWGLPVPNDLDSKEEFYNYKRAQMCGEVAVLTISEFIYCKYLYDICASQTDAFSHQLKELLIQRNAVPLMLEGGPLYGKTLLQLGGRLDSLLHKKVNPKWVRDDVSASKFRADYVPMLEEDRRAVDHNWAIMLSTGWKPEGGPHVRYSQNLDGLELTLWMLSDFEHLLDTDASVDVELRDFNRARRRKIVLPQDWK